MDDHPVFQVRPQDLPFIEQRMREKGWTLTQALNDMYGQGRTSATLPQQSLQAPQAPRVPQPTREALTAPHAHILHRLHEDVTTGNNLNPSYATNDGQTQHGDSSLAASHTKKEGEEFVATGEETREVELATKILQAAGRMAKTPDVEQIIRLADELKKMHGKE